MIKRVIRGYDIIGNIAILKFSDKISLKQKKEEASKFLLQHKNIKTILEKSEKIKGKLRTYKTKFILGKNTKETIHKESNCLFKLDVEKCYFSPRLSTERTQISEQIKKLKNKKNILVMFAGVAPYSIIIAKDNIWSSIYSNELNKIACKYAEENIRLNKLKNLKIIQGDARKILSLIKKYKLPKKYDIIVMPRAQLEYNFLKEAFLVSKKNTTIFFREFCKQEEIRAKIKNIEKEAKKQKKKIEVLNITRTQEISPYKFRYMVGFKVF
jgi:tRNA (guanine37-N1)-methyltransferase